MTALDLARMLENEVNAVECYLRPARRAGNKALAREHIAEAAIMAAKLVKALEDCECTTVDSAEQN